MGVEEIEMQTVMTTNNAYDSILLVDDDKVIGAWTATPEIVNTYLRDGANAAEWSATWPDRTEVADYGTEIGRDGCIDDASRRSFWA
jgi:hypothetical protein